MSTLAHEDRRVGSPRLARLGVRLGVVGGALGIVAGLVEVTAGPSIRIWVGDKSDTTRLGIATIVLCLVALAAALELARRPDTHSPRRFALAIAMLVPGLICFTTAGRLSFVPGALLASAGVIQLLELRTDFVEVRDVAGRNWTAVLTLVLGCFMVFLGATALGPAGVLGVAGGLLVIGLIAARDRLNPSVSLPLLVLAVLPFVVLTWWSVATPLIGVFALTLGTLALRVPPSREPRPTSHA